MATIELVPPSEQKAAAERWKELEQRVRNTGLTNSWPWIETWLKHYGDVPHLFAFGIKDSQSIGAALITFPQYRALRGTIPIPSISLGTIGSQEPGTPCVEHNRLLVAPGYLDLFAEGLLTHIKQLHWERFELKSFIPEYGNALIKAGKNVGINFTVEERPSPTFDIQKAVSEGYKDATSAIPSKKNKQIIKRNINRLNKLFGSLTEEWADTPEQVRDIFRELVDLHTRRWQDQGKPGELSTNRVKKFHEDLIEALWPSGSLNAFRVKYGDSTLGCLLNFVDEENKIIGYKSGFAFSSDDIEKLTPGKVTITLFLSQAMRRGFSEVDFGEGESAYKRELTNSEGTSVWAIAQRGLRPKLIKMTHEGKASMFALFGLALKTWSRSHLPGQLV
jgi:hypothetical protein